MTDYLDRIICGDCLEVMRGMPDGCVDAVVTDPPYNASGSNVEFVWKGYVTVNQEWDKGFSPMSALEEIRRVLTPHGSALLFCSHHLLPEYLQWSGMRLQQIIHWVKNNPFPAIAKVYTPCVEYCLWFVNGSPYTFNKSNAGTNFITTSICGGHERTEHPTQKPLRLIKQLLSVHTEQGDIILDPFLGSGTTAVACVETGRHYIGIELEEKYCEIARRRVAEATPSLFAREAVTV